MVSTQMFWFSVAEPVEDRQTDMFDNMSAAVF